MSALQPGHAVGEPVARIDGIAKVTGRARDVDDLVVDGALHGATLRSQVAHGRLRSIARDPGFDWTGITVVTAADLPEGVVNAVALIENDQPALVPIGGTIRHRDEAIALVAAADRATAHRALAHLRVEVDELPAALSIEESLAAQVLLRGDDNVFTRYHIRKGDGDIEAALAACDLVIEGTYRTGAQEQMYIEPQGMIARWDSGRVRVVGSLQCPYYVHKALRVLFGLPGDRVVVDQAVTGGGFGGKEEYPSMVAAHAALLARAAGRPVRLIYDREEDIRVTTKRHPSRVRHRLGLRGDGTIAAIDVDVVLDGGAYLTLSPVVLSRAVLHAAGPYRCDQVRVVGRAVATNTPPHGAFRGFGAPQTTFAYERQMDKAARRLGIDPLELRRRNMLRPGDSTATGQVLTHSVGSAAVIDAVTRASSTPAPARPVTGEVARGRGVAFYFHGAGFTGSGEQKLAGRATIALRPGGRFEVLSSSTDIGQGALTIFAQIAADALGVPVDRVDVREPSTERVPDSGPTVASRTCMVVGGVVERAARQLAEQIDAWAAARGLAGATRGQAAIAMATATGGATATAQYQAPPGIEWDDATYTGSAYPVFGWACCLVDVAVDRDTYEVTVERCVHAVDVGKAINPTIVKGQIEGGTLQALGWGLLEEVIYRDGQVANPTMTNCIIPTAADAPEMETLVIEEPFPFGPHGAKGVGELPMDGPAAAAASAVSAALGTEFDQLPVSPERIAQALGRDA